MTISVERIRYPKPADFEPEPFFPLDHKRAGKPRCQAWNPNQGRQCNNSPMERKRVCDSHGGKAPSGPESPNWKHGKYEGRNATATPHYESIASTRWRSAYLRFLEDTEALSLDPDIALNSARIEAQIEAISNAINHTFLEELETIVTSIKGAMAENNIRGLAQGVIAIDEMIVKAREDMLGQDKLDKLIGQRVTLVDKQQRAIERNDRHMAMGQVIALILRTFSAVADIIEDHCDPSVYQIIMDQSRLAIQPAMIYLGEESLIVEEDPDTKEQNGR